MSRKHCFFPVLCAVTLFSSLPNVSAAEQEQMVELMPAVKITQSEAKLLADNHKELEANEALVQRVLKHLGLEHSSPQLPNYRVIGLNSILAVMNQIHYTAVAKKLAVALPNHEMSHCNSSIECNYALHRYNNDILRAIAEKLELKTPTKLPQSPDSIANANKLIHQNHEILTTIATKLGVSPG